MEAQKQALEICLNNNKSPAQQFNEMQDLGLDLEDMLEIALLASEKTK